MEAFSEFIDNQPLDQPQIVFVNKVIDYVEQNGYIENIKELMKPPFDKPLSFSRLFDSKKQAKLVEIVKGFRENAVEVVGWGMNMGPVRRRRKCELLGAIAIGNK